MLDRRTRNVEIFQNTMEMCNNDEYLAQSIRYSIENQKFISEKEKNFQIDVRKCSQARIYISEKRSFEAAQKYAASGKKVCVLNFASSTNPGGGVTRGSSAQEESLCRCSTLFKCLDTGKMKDLFYLPHRRQNDPLYNNDCIYTPDVCVFKSDTGAPKVLDRSLWWKVDVLTCAAPNLREVPSNEMNPWAGQEAAQISIPELEKLLSGRIRRIFEVAASNDNQVLILGAFGCGAFRNPPKVVAKIFKKEMEKFPGCFEVIEYAIYHTEREVENYTAFKEIFGGVTIN